MSLINFSKDEQRKSICFWYEVNTKGKKYAKSLTCREFNGKSYIKTQAGMYQVLKIMITVEKSKELLRKFSKMSQKYFQTCFVTLRRKSIMPKLRDFKMFTTE